MNYYKVSAWQEDGRSGGTYSKALKVDSLHSLQTKVPHWVGDLFTHFGIVAFDQLDYYQASKDRRRSGYIGHEIIVQLIDQQEYHRLREKERQNNEELEKQVKEQKIAMDIHNAREQNRQRLIESALNKLTAEEVEALGYKWL